jgi:Tfp pilus assembly protein PilX
MRPLKRRRRGADTLQMVREALRRIRVSQRGNAMVVVMGTILTLTLVTSTIATTASTSSKNANTDRNSKRALAAAEAGLEIAQLQLAQTASLPASSCLVAGGANPSGAECPTGAPGNIGNGASYTYFVSQQVNGTTVTCPASQGAAAAPPGATERCITSIGTVNGTTRRVQALVRRQPGSAIWQTAGIVGKDRVEMKNNALIWAPIGTNGQLDLQNNNQIYNTARLGPGGSITNPSQIVANPKSVSVPAWDLPSVDVPVPVPPTNPNSYNNSALSTTYYKASQGGQPPRRFRIPNGSYTMPAGTYNFCSMELDNSITLNVAGPVRIYIDSPARTGSGCTSGGRFMLNNDVTVNSGGTAANFVVLVYGSRNEAANADVNCPSGKTGSDVFYCNEIDFTGAVYAPDSTVTIDNDVRFRGGVASKSIEFKNNAQFWWDSSVTTINVGPPGGVSRVRWRECRRQPPTPSDPESGC